MTDVQTSNALEEIEPSVALNETPADDIPSPKPATKSDCEVLTSGEQYWKNRYDWLLSSGYKLGPRYHPDWKPSWKGDDWYNAEDALFTQRDAINYAERVSDGTMVALKKLVTPTNERELSLITMLSQDASDPDNHCVPILDTLTLPSTFEDSSSVKIIAMPLLHSWNEPPFSSVGEAVDFIRQMFKGLKYLHDREIAFRDISPTNVMMDASAMFPEMWHPCQESMRLDYTGASTAKYTRTRRPPKYYYVDFGLSRQYDDETERLETALEGTDLSAPELQLLQAYEPFALDIYCLGNFLQGTFTKGNPGGDSYAGSGRFQFLAPLLESMVHEDPRKRPTINAAVSQLQKAIDTLSIRDLRSHCPREDAEDYNLAGKAVRSMVHWTHQLANIVRGLPPIPVHKSSSPTSTSTIPK